MRSAPIVVAGVLAVASAGCAYPGIYGHRPMPAHAAMLPAPAPPSPVGRWDNVMMLDPGTPLRMLAMDGSRTEGRFHSASPAVLRLAIEGSVVEVAMAGVARVDRQPHVGSAAWDEAARGATVGLGAVGVLGLLAGRVPPPRIWAAGAITGGYAGVQAQMHAAGPGTIYLAAWGQEHKRTGDRENPRN